MALMDILGPAAAGLRAGMEAERAGKKEEADQFYRETQQALTALSTVGGLQTQQARLGLLREQQQLAGRLAPSQIRGAEAGARLAETQASAAESALERQQAVAEAMDKLLGLFEGKPVPYEVVSMYRDVLAGRADIQRLQEAERLKGPEAEARAGVAEARGREAKAGEQERVREGLTSAGLDPDQAMVQSYMIANKLWESPQWYREQLTGINETISSIQQRATLEEVRKDVQAAGAPGDAMGFFMAAMAGAATAGGRLSPQGKQDAINRLRNWYRTMLNRARSVYPQQDWGGLEMETYPPEVTGEATIGLPPAPSQRGPFGGGAAPGAPETPEPEEPAIDVDAIRRQLEGK